jgi:hypothetical protein
MISKLSLARLKDIRLQAIELQKCECSTNYRDVMSDDVIQLVDSVLLLREALVQCTKAMRKSVEDGSTCHLDASDDAGDFWYEALLVADETLK